MPTVLATSRSIGHGFSKQPQAGVRLIAGEGVEGDAHRGRTTQHLYLKRKEPALPNLCQVHLFSSEMLGELAGLGFAIKAGEMGENLLTEGLELLTLPRGTQLHIGVEAIVEVTGLRTPCSQIEAFRPGLQQHMYGPPARGTGRRTLRAGIMSIVRVGGEVYPGDGIRVTLPAEPYEALGPV